MTFDMTPDVLATIESLVYSAYADEEKDWKESDQPAEHFFHQVKQLADWLDANRPKPF